VTGVAEHADNLRGVVAYAAAVSTYIEAKHGAFERTTRGVPSPVSVMSEIFNVVAHFARDCHAMRVMYDRLASLMRCLPVTTARHRSSPCPPSRHLLHRLVQSLSHTDRNL
jgi:hypothetical protein